MVYGASVHLNEMERLIKSGAGKGVNHGYEHYVPTNCGRPRSRRYFLAGHLLA